MTDSRAFRGRFADAGNPWIKDAGGDRLSLEAEAITHAAGRPQPAPLA